MTNQDDIQAELIDSDEPNKQPPIREYWFDPLAEERRGGGQEDSDLWAPPSGF
jgi:hypothetical protein